jgi:hypothetical protein
VTKIEKITNILGENATDPVVLRGETPPMGIYTWEDGVFVLVNGSDMEFPDMTKEEQKLILKKIEKGLYDIDASFQG